MSKRKKAKNPSGEARQNALGVLLCLMYGDMWPDEIARKAEVSAATVYRVVSDARKVGFAVWKDVSGKLYADVPWRVEA